MFSQSLVDKLKEGFIPYHNSEIASQQSAYLRHLFIFLGIPKPLRHSIEREIFKSLPSFSTQELGEAMLLLWNQTEREFHYSALTLAMSFKKHWSIELLPIYEKMIREKSWWDTVDTLAANLVGPLVKLNPFLIHNMDQWIKDDHLWIRRSALLFQLKWKKDTDSNRLFSYCSLLMHEKDFFIRKAIGWALREYSKYNKEEVENLSV